MPMIEIAPSMNLYYEVNGEGTPIVFIPPPAMGYITFKRQEPLAEKYKIISYDLRGNGQSDYSNEPVTIQLLANDLFHLLNKLGIKKPIICGYSNGGSIALEYALSYPDHISGLLLIGGFSEVNSFILKNQFKTGILATKYNGLSLLGRVLGASHGTNKYEKKELEQYIKKSNANTVYQMYKTGLAYCCTERLSLINVPVLLIYGEKDRYIHHYHKPFAEAISNIDIVYISGARHRIPTRHYYELNQIIDRFCLNHK